MLVGANVKDVQRGRIVGIGDVETSGGRAGKGTEVKSSG